MRVDSGALVLVVGGGNPPLSFHSSPFHPFPSSFYLALSYPLPFCECGSGRSPAAKSILETVVKLQLQLMMLVMHSISGVASYGALEHVSPRLSTVSFLVHFGVNLRANYRYPIQVLYSLRD